MKDKVTRVKSLKNGHKGGWITGHCPNKNMLYKFDQVSHLKRGKEKRTKLVSAGITQVRKLASLGTTSEEIKDSIQQIWEEKSTTSPHQKSLQINLWRRVGNINLILMITSIVYLKPQMLILKTKMMRIIVVIQTILHAKVI